MEKLQIYLQKAKLHKAFDVATGRGEFISTIRYLAGDGIQITGIDKRGRMLETSRKQFPEVEFIEGDAYHLPFADKSYDLVCISNSLHHFQEPEKVISEMRRVVQPEGYILIQEMVCDEDQTAAQKSHIQIHHYCAEVDMLSGTYHKKTWDSQKLEDFIGREFEELILKSEYSYPVEDEHDEKQIASICQAIEHYLIKLKGIKEKEYLREKGESVRIYLQEHGFASAREKLYLMKL